MDLNDDLDELYANEDDEIEPRNMTPWLILLAIVFVLALIGIIVIPIRYYCIMKLKKFKRDKLKKVN